MIVTIVIKKINRAVFSPYEPLEIMIGFHNQKGEEQATQLVSANLFPKDIVEGQRVAFVSLAPQHDLQF